MRFALILGLAGALAGLPTLALAEKDPDAAGVAEAIRYEKAKQAAADRQERIEAQRARGSRPEEHATPEMKTKPRAVKSASARKTPPPQRDSR
jgi:hypothetical protein